MVQSLKQAPRNTILFIASGNELKKCLWKWSFGISILLLNEDVNVDYPTSENNYHSRWSPCLREVCFYYFTECDMILKFIEWSFRFSQFDCHLAMMEVDIWIRETSVRFQSNHCHVQVGQMLKSWFAAEEWVIIKVMENSKMLSVQGNELLTIEVV